MTLQNKLKYSAAAILGMALSTMALSTPSQAQSSDSAYIGTIFMTAGAWCPRGSAEANGQLLPISSNSSLFSVIGTAYGGDGRSTFGLPDLRGRAPIHAGMMNDGSAGYNQGQMGGRATTVLTSANLPTHIHNIPPHTHTAKLLADTDLPSTNSPQGAALTQFPNNVYSATAPGAATMSSGSIEVQPNVEGQTFGTGGNQAFDIRGPYNTVRMCVVTDGLYPSRN